MGKLTEYEVTDKVASLLDAVRAGELAARHELVLAFDPYCKYQIGRLKVRNRTTREECRSECLLAVTEAVARIADGTTEETDPGNLVALVNKAIRATARRTAVSDTLIGVPAYTVTRDKQTRPPEKRRKPTVLETMTSHTEAAPTSLDTSQEVWDEVLRSCQRKHERKVVEGFALGHTAEKIAKDLDIEPSTVYNHRRAVKQQYEERINA